MSEGKRRVPGPDRRRGGFSIVEVIIAIVILAVGVVGLAGTTAYIARQVTLADVMTERSAAFQTIVDRIQSLPFDSVKSGSTRIGIFTTSWSSALSGPQTKVVTVVTVGPGLSSSNPPRNDPAAADTFVFRVLRR